MRKLVYSLVAVGLVLFLALGMLPPAQALAQEETRGWGFGMKQRLGNGRGPMQGGPGMMGGKGFLPGQLTELLGLDWAQLREKLAEGKSIAEITKEQGKSLEEIKAKLLAEHQTRLDQLVAEKRITAEQAQEMQKVMTERLDGMLEGKFTRGQGMGGRKGFGRGFCYGQQGFTDTKL